MRQKPYISRRQGRNDFRRLTVPRENRAGEQRLWQRVTEGQGSSLGGKQHLQVDGRVWNNFRVCSSCNVSSCFLLSVPCKLVGGGGGRPLGRGRQGGGERVGEQRLKESRRWCASVTLGGILVTRLQGQAVVCSWPPARTGVGLVVRMCARRQKPTERAVSHPYFLPLSCSAGGYSSGLCTTSLF